MIETIRVDLHCHSSLSDGDHSPAYVAHSIAATGAEGAALTDHNSVSGQHQFRAVMERRGVRTVVGLEMDARSPNGVLHLLGYGFDPEYQPLLDALFTLRQPLRASARYWMGRLRARTSRGSPREPESPASQLDPEPPRPLSTAEVIELLHEAGGLAFLGHPLAGLQGFRDLDNLLDRLQPQGLDGMEVFHKPYSKDTQQTLLDMALHRRLLCIAGSDFHGLHHSDGTDPGVDMPLVHWKDFLSALEFGGPKGRISRQSNKLLT